MSHVKKIEHRVGLILSHNGHEDPLEVEVMCLSRDCGIEGNRRANLAGILHIKRNVIIKFLRLFRELRGHILTLRFLSLQFKDSSRQLQDLILDFAVLEL